MDFRASAGRSLGADASASLQEKLRPRYTAFKERRAFEARWEIRPGQQPLAGGADQGLQGYILESPDGRDIGQFRLDGFTYNRLRPYTNGQAVLDEALRLWSLYVEVAAPALVSRVALRYINHLLLATPVDGLGEYLADPPGHPHGSPGHIENSLSRLVTYDPPRGIRVITTQVLEKPVDASSLTVILDIDVFRLADLGVHADELRPTLETLRDVKNEVFFGSITERTAELYE